jgi:two-component system, OmpR family, sensor kinase
MNTARTSLSRLSMGNWPLRNRLILIPVLLSAVAIISSDFASTTLMRSFLVKQVDTQLDSIAGGSILRLDRAGIDPNFVEHDDNGTTLRAVQPLGGVPTATSVTVLDTSGKVIARFGGELEGSSATSPFDGFTPIDVIKKNDRPFTLTEKAGQPDIRAIARLLPSGEGTVIVSVALESVDRTLGQMRWLYLLISLIVLSLIAIFSWLMIRLSLRPLRNIEKTAAAIADGDFSARLDEKNPNTEVGHLTQSLNTMLARIESAFDARTQSESKLRRFVADASHELRTPLTAIRGFAELHRQGAVEGPDKVRELINRIENESIRMGTLVEDLLLLARLDQHRTVEREPVDISLLVQEAVASAQAAGPNHPITIFSPDEEIFVLGDSMRIHQSLANLLANARTHTPAGTAITVSISQSHDETLVSVSDNGPGLSPEEQAKIFERFYRVDTSRTRVSGEGSGLGLSIVDAVMKSNGGSVSVQSELGKGCTFTLHFPITEE